MPLIGINQRQKNAIVKKSKLNKFTPIVIKTHLKLTRLKLLLVLIFKSLIHNQPNKIIRPKTITRMGMALPKLACLLMPASRNLPAAWLYAST